MSTLNPEEVDCLTKIMGSSYRGARGLNIDVCARLERKGLLHIIRDTPDYWAVAQTPEEASAARCLLIPDYKPPHGPEWLAQLEKASTK